MRAARALEIRFVFAFAADVGEMFAFSEDVDEFAAEDVGVYLLSDLRGEACQESRCWLGSLVDGREGMRAGGWEWLGSVVHSLFCSLCGFVVLLKASFIGFVDVVERGDDGFGMFDDFDAD